MDTTLIFTAVLVCCVYSLILWKDNIVFRIAEHALVALSLANLTVVSINTIGKKGFSPLINGEFLFIVPIVLGPFLYTRISKKYSWMSRVPMAMLLGIGLGLGIRRSAEVDIVGQLTATILPLIGGNQFPFDNIVIILGTLASLSYFLFTFEIKGAMKKPIDYLQRVGRYMLLISFGAVFGNTLMSRLIWIIDRIDLVLHAIGIT